MPDEKDAIQALLQTMEKVQLLKDTLRTCWTRSGRQESSAEHSWSLAMFALLVQKQYDSLDREKILTLCLIHDIAEAYTGDISAALAPDPADKYEAECQAVRQIFSALEHDQRQYLFSLWQEYEQGLSAEAKLVKALDKAETILQHHRGKNPADFDYAFNLHYGAALFSADPYLQQIRAKLDDKTKTHLR